MRGGGISLRGPPHPPHLSSHSPQSLISRGLPHAHLQILLLGLRRERGLGGRGGFSSPGGPRPQHPLEGREEAGMGAPGLPGHLSSYGDMQFPRMATRWSTNPTNADTWVNPGILASRWESLWKPAAPGPPSVQQAFLSILPRPRASRGREGAVPRPHRGTLASPSTLAHPWGLETVKLGRHVLQSFLGSLRTPHWEALCQKPSS